MGDRRMEWRHPVLEGLAVLAGILIAFAIDAGWDAHVERQLAEAHLVALTAELETAEAGYRRHLGYLDLHDERVARLLSEARSYSGNDLAMDTLLILLGPYAPYHPPMSALDDLGGGGGLAAIRSPELRRAIAGYRRTLQADATEQSGFVSYWLVEVEPYWGRHINTRRLLEAMPAYADHRDLLPELPAVPFDPRYEELLGDKVFLNQLSTWVHKVWRVRRSALGVLDDISSLKALIESR